MPFLLKDFKLTIFHVWHRMSPDIPCYFRVCVLQTALLYFCPRSGWIRVWFGFKWDGGENFWVPLCWGTKQYVEKCLHTLWAAALCCLCQDGSLLQVRVMWSSHKPSPWQTTPLTKLQTLFTHHMPCAPGSGVGAEPGTCNIPLGWVNFAPESTEKVTPSLSRWLCPCWTVGSESPLVG